MTRRAIAVALVVAGLAACANDDASQLDRVDVEGVDCVVVRNRANRIQFVDCDWGDQ